MDDGPYALSPFNRALLLSSAEESYLVARSGKPLPDDAHNRNGVPSKWQGFRVSGSGSEIQRPLYVYRICTDKSRGGSYQLAQVRWCETLPGGIWPPGWFIIGVWTLWVSRWERAVLVASAHDVSISFADLCCVARACLQETCYPLDTRKTTEGHEEIRNQLTTIIKWARDWLL